MVQVAPVTETVDKEWNRVTLTVALDGTITGHTGRLALFGLKKEVPPMLLEWGLCQCIS